jgi:hypothetical protein
MATSFPNFRNNSNSDYPKSSLTLISEYQKLLRVDSARPDRLQAGTAGSAGCIFFNRRCEPTVGAWRRATTGFAQ